MTERRTQGLDVFRDMPPGLIPDDLTSERDGGIADELGDLSREHVFVRSGRVRVWVGAPAARLPSAG